MPTFPIPVFVTFILFFAAAHMWYTRGRLSMLVLLLFICATQSLIIALAQHYELRGMRYLQPIMASLIPPVAWMAYRATNESIPQAMELLHILSPLSAIAAILVAPQFLDVLLPGMFTVYGVLILYHAREGANSQPNALLSSGDIPAKIWITIGIALIASAISDVLIITSQIAGYADLRPWIISIFSLGNLFVIGLLGLSPHLNIVNTRQPNSTPLTLELDKQIWEKIQTYMEEHKPYLDPDLTITRLARKLSVPAKKLSSTINRATGNNVSRYINAARIKTAQDAMLDGETVTNSMFLSGFNTKSNFNREFKRIVGDSPSSWLNKQ